MFLCDVLLFLGYVCTHKSLWVSHLSCSRACKGRAWNKDCVLVLSLLLLLLDCFESFPSRHLHYFISWYLWSGKRKNGLIKSTVGSSKEKGTEGVGSFQFCFFLTRRKCSTSYWESQWLCWASVEGRQGARSTWMLL